MAPFDAVKEPEAGNSAIPVGAPARAQDKNRWGIFVVVLLVVAGGWWYLRSRGNQQSNNASAGVSANSARLGGAPENGVVPVVVATAHRGDLPVYFKGLGNVTAFNTVTVRSRVDGQIVKINFTEGQYVKEGDSLVEIDPRPFQVQLQQAQGQLAKDEAARKDAQVNLDRYQLLFKEGVVPRQQVDTQQAQVGQFEGAIKADQGTIDSAKLQIVYAHVT